MKDAYTTIRTKFRILFNLGCRGDFLEQITNGLTTIERKLIYLTIVTLKTSA